MKKLITFVCVIALTLSLGTIAYASEVDASSLTTDSSADNSIVVEQKKPSNLKVDKEQKKAAVQAFRAVVKAQRDIIKANRAANFALRSSNKTLRKSIASSLKAIKASDTPLDTEIVEQLKVYKTELKAIGEALKLTRGDIKEINAGNKDNKKALNYEAMEVAFTQITSIQADRNSKLTRINEILNAMADL
ncbi:MAG: hypothetical protein ACYDEX_21475, partial [Mobilitalea sp.]